MPREADALKIRPWAASGDRVLPENSTPALDRDTGYPASFSQVGGNTPSREEWNQFRYEVTLMLHEINRGGVLEWTGASDHPGYLADAIVRGSDGVLYRAVRANAGVDPTTDANDADWIPVLAGVLFASTVVDAINTRLGTTAWQSGGVTAAPDASTSTRGIVELANTAEHNALSDVLRACVPGRLPTASTSQRGLTTLAGASDTTSTTKAVTPAGLEDRLSGLFSGMEGVRYTSSQTFAWGRDFTKAVAIIVGGSGGTGGGGGGGAAPADSTNATGQGGSGWCWGGWCERYGWIGGIARDRRGGWVARAAEHTGLVARVAVEVSRVVAAEVVVVVAKQAGLVVNPDW